MLRQGSLQADLGPAAGCARSAGKGYAPGQSGRPGPADRGRGGSAAGQTRGVGKPAEGGAGTAFARASARRGPGGAERQARAAPRLPA